jgi:hypothetical protein
VNNKRQKVPATSPTFVKLPSRGRKSKTAAVAINPVLAALIPSSEARINAVLLQSVPEAVDKKDKKSSGQKYTGCGHKTSQQFATHTIFPHRQSANKSCKRKTGPGTTWAIASPDKNS